MADADLLRMLLQHEVEQFLFAEAECLDERRFEDWLDLLTDDVRYWMPIARNVEHVALGNEFTHEQEEAAWFDEGKETLRQRVLQIRTGMHWAEEPVSRTSHLVTNVIIASGSNDQELDVRCRFLFYRNRLDGDTDIMVGKRFDQLRRTSDGLKICHRRIFLDQSTLLAKNLTIPL